MSQTTDNKRPLEVAQGVYQIELPTPFSVGPVNVYLIMGSELTLVDVGPYTPAAWDALVSGLELLGCQLGDVRQVVLTHHHVDHCGLLKKVKAASGALSFAHPLAVPYVEMDQTFMEHHNQFFYHLYRESGVPQKMMAVIEKFYQLMQTFCQPAGIDGLLKHDRPLPGLPEWQVLYTPGHSQSHLSLYRSSDQVLIGGDHILKRISSNAFIEPPRDPSQARALTLVQYRTALQMCADMDIELVLPGHGELVTNHRELISARLQRNWERTGVLRRLLQDGQKTAYELSALLFPDLYEKELALTLSETVGHIDLLTILHQVEREQRDGILYYSL
ncbi:MBL fold metallo-hydrolase [Brevibacillus humidisoli]|uniref:MBL fold metallo-hydrolase n=1 Tax=Brevibacillus humidisoli TaxID=2895522 RepID=UPI001E505CD8|nr:MBL fold metallo-hydrolase [Brevibacillus humidisoli]UFJ41565.1 MBL fold metallo-hydrolase [Brevibacillus humidisoli]